VFQLEFLAIKGLQTAADPDQARKCSSLPRARTENLNKLSQARLAEIHAEARLAKRVAKLRPQTRGECAGGERPCPWLGCRHHLALDVHEETGGLKENFPHLRILQEPENLVYLRDTCALDVADRVQDEGGEMEWEDIGRTMNLGIERCRQLAAKGQQDIRVRDVREDVLMRINARSRK
jgi:hypothetical protein